MMPNRVLPRLLANIDHSNTFGCWPWIKSTYGHGYGQIGWVEDGRRIMVMAHRLTYWLAFGRIPSNMVVHHTCHNRRCCNPAHLRLKTMPENSADNMHRQKTHCPRGHLYSESNTYIKPSTGHRECRVCRRRMRRKKIEQEWI